jgi:hypothetical protein
MEEKSVMAKSGKVNQKKTSTTTKYQSAPVDPQTVASQSYSTPFRLRSFL